MFIFGKWILPSVQHVSKYFTNEKQQEPMRAARVPYDKKTNSKNALQKEETQVVLLA